MFLFCHMSYFVFDIGFVYYSLICSMSEQGRGVICIAPLLFLELSYVPGQFCCIHLTYSYIFSCIVKTQSIFFVVVWTYSCPFRRAVTKTKKRKTGKLSKKLLHPKSIAHSPWKRLILHLSWVHK